MRVLVRMSENEEGEGDGEDREEEEDADVDAKRDARADADKDHYEDCNDGNMGSFNFRASCHGSSLVCHMLGSVQRRRTLSTQKGALHRKLEVCATTRIFECRR